MSEKKQKYLTKVNAGEDRKVEEFRLLAGFDNFYLIKEGNQKALVINYGTLMYPQFANKESIEKEMKEKIQDFFEVGDSLILLKYSPAEEAKVEEIMIRNKQEFDIWFFYPGIFNLRYLGF